MGVIALPAFSFTPREIKVNVIFIGSEDYKLFYLENFGVLLAGSCSIWRNF